MSQTPHDDAPDLELPPIDEIERTLGLGTKDREDLGAFYEMNTRDLPLARFLGLCIALLVAPVHNVVVLGSVDWSAVGLAAAVLLGYALGSWALLRVWFHRSRVHLGFVFVYADLLAFAWLVHLTGGPRSLYWPIFLIRVADQMWLNRRRAGAMVVLSVLCYGSLVVLWSSAGIPLDPGTEAMKLVVLGGVGVVLLLVARGPWDVYGRSAAARDLIVRLEEQSLELDEQRRRAQAANRSKSEFLARMSHELRTPLNSVVGFTNVLLKRTGQTMGSRETNYLERIRQNGIHLLALINDILDLARIEQGKMSIEITEVDLATLVRETTQQLDDRAVERHVRLEMEVPRTSAPVAADEVRLRQVLINLVGNALKFTDEGSVTVRVVTEGDDPTPRRLEVEDTGIGIAPERLDRIFEAFEQLEGGTARRHGGTGLGLAISRSLCVLMGLRLTVDSTPGEGSTFTIWFGDGAAAAPTHPGEEHGERPRTEGAVTGGGP